MVAGKSGTYYGQPMTAGDIYTIAGHGKAPINGSYSVVVDSAGNVVVDGLLAIQVLAESNGAYYGQKMTKGSVYAITGDGANGLGDGGPATGTSVGSPDPLAIGAAGNLLIADSFSQRVRSISR